MLTEMLVEVSPRQDTGKNESRRLRAAGMVPGVVYGGERPVVAISIEHGKILDILRSESGENTLFTLKLGGTDSKRVVMIRDYQRDPVKGRLIHVDFVRVDLNKPIEVMVPIHIVGIPVGVKVDGGLMDHVIRDVQVSCLPSDIPEGLELDVSEVHIGQHLSVRDLKVSDKVKILTDPDQTVIVVAMPKAEEVAATPVAGLPVEAVPSEPELIKKGGKETAEEPAPAEGKKGGEAKKGGEPKKGKEGGKS